MHMWEVYIYVVYSRHIPGIYRKSGFQMNTEQTVTVTDKPEPEVPVVHYHHEHVVCRPVP